MHYQKTVLPNGITVLSESIDSVRSVSLGIWFQVGSRDETSAEAGLSHFNEHMMFKGTPLHSARELSELFDRYGARQNAFTSREATCYYASFVDQSLEQVFGLIADMVQNANLDQESCELEREVVIEEIARSEDDPGDRVYELFSRSFMPDHNLGKPIAGTKESVGSFGSDESKAYRAKHYHAKNCVVVAAGNLNHDKLVELSERYLSGMNSAGEKNSGKRKAPTTYKTGRVYENMPIEQSHIVIGCDSIPATSEERYAYTLMNFIYGGSMSSRLFQEVREKQGLVYTVYSGNYLNSDAGQLVVYAGTRPDNTERVIETSLEELAKMAAGQISQEDLDMAKSAVIGSLALDLESTSNRMRTLGGRFLDGRDILSFEESIARFEKVQLNDLIETAQVLHNKEKLIAVVGPRE